MSKLEKIEQALEHLFSKYDYHLYDRRRAIHPKILLELGNLGLFGMKVPEEKGGAGLSDEETFKVFQMLGYHDFTIASFLGVHNSLFLGTLFSAGKQFEMLDDGFFNGRKIGAFAITEKNNGSLPQKMSSTAYYNQENDTFTINGEKLWIGAASWSSGIVFFAKCTNENPYQKKDGIICFLLKSNDLCVEYKGEFITLGLNSLVQDYVSVTNYIATSRDIVSTDGYIDGKNAMNFARLTIASFSLGSLKKSTNLLEGYYNSKIKETASIPAYIRFSLYELNSHLADLQKLFNVCIKEIYQSKESVEKELLSIVVKVGFCEIVNLLVDKSLQLMGGRGYSENYQVAKIYRDVRIGRIFEGSSEAMYSHVGKAFFLFSKKYSILKNVDIYLKSRFSSNLCNQYNNIKSKYLKDLFCSVYGKAILFSILQQFNTSSSLICFLDIQIMLSLNEGANLPFKEELPGYTLNSKKVNIAYYGDLNQPII